MIDVHRLAVLREVAHAGSFAGAAAALHHTPSAVSQQIAALERGTGACSSIAAPAASSSTDAGRTLLATADAIHAELQLAAQRLRALAAGRPQALTVVTFPSAGEPLLAPSLTAMTAAVGNPVEITVIEAEPDEALGAVRDGRADLALVYHFHTAAPPRGWRAAAGPGTYVPLVSDPLRLLVPAAARSPADPRPPAWPRSRTNAGSKAGAMSVMSPTCLPPSAVSVSRSPAAPATTAHERPGRRRRRRRPGAQPRPHRQPGGMRPPDHPPAHPLHRRLAPSAASAKPRSPGNC